jgi:hypothetical protein
MGSPSSEQGLNWSKQFNQPNMMENTSTAQLIMIYNCPHKLKWRIKGQAQTVRNKLCIDIQLICTSQHHKISFMICNTVSTIASFVQRLVSRVPGPHMTWTCHLCMIYGTTFGLCFHSALRELYLTGKFIVSYQHWSWIWVKLSSAIIKSIQ